MTPHEHITFTRVTTADFDELAALRIAAMRESLERVGRFDPERDRERLWKSFDPEHTHVIVCEGQRIGFYTFRPAVEGYHLDHLYIHPDWQSRGIGSQVMRRLLAEADARQLPIRLGALRGSESTTFYRRHDFKITSKDEWDIYYVRTARPRPSFVASKSIESACVSLRPVSEADLPSLLAIYSDAAVVKHLGHTPWQSIADAEAWFGRMAKHHAAGSAVEFVIVEKQTGQCIGRCGLFDYEATDAQASVGYALGRPYWRQGFMREALTSLIECAFGEMGIRRLEAKVEALNTASIALLRRLGFTREGVLRKRWAAQDGAIDAEIFGLLRPEWRGLNASTTAEPATAPASVFFRELRPAEFQVIRPLWERLNQQHASYDTTFASEIASRTFGVRLRELCAEPTGKRIHIEVASISPDGPPIAYCTASITADGIGEIDSLFVSPEHRRRGIASSLMKSAMNWLRAGGTVTQRVVVFYANTEALAFYGRFGFQPRNIEMQKMPLGDRIHP